MRRPRKPRAAEQQQTFVRTHCPACGVLDLPAADITLVIHPGRPDLASFHFACPTCSETWTRAACKVVVSLLLSARCTVQRASSELSDPARQCADPLPALDALDVEDFLARLFGDAGGASWALH